MNFSMIVGPSSHPASGARRAASTPRAGRSGRVGHLGQRGAHALQQRRRIGVPVALDRLDARRIGLDAPERHRLVRRQRDDALRLREPVAGELGEVRPDLAGLPALVVAGIGIGQAGRKRRVACSTRRRSASARRSSRASTSAVMWPGRSHDRRGQLAEPLDRKRDRVAGLEVALRGSRRGSRAGSRCRRCPSRGGRRGAAETSAEARSTISPKVKCADDQCPARARCPLTVAVIAKIVALVAPDIGQLVRGDQPWADGGGEVLALGRAEPDGLSSRCRSRALQSLRTM